MKKNSNNQYQEVYMNNEYIIKKNITKESAYAPATPFEFVENSYNPTYCNVREKIYENNYFEVRLTMWEENGVEIPNIFEVLFSPKDEYSSTFPYFTNDGITKIGKQIAVDAGSFSFSFFNHIDFFNVDENSDEILQISKDSVIEFDKIIRKEYPGYCFVPKATEITEDYDSQYFRDRMMKREKLENLSIEICYGEDACN